MHELLLYAVVPHNRHDQILQILAGIAAMQPISLLEKRLICKPTNSTNRNGIKAEIGQNKQFRALEAQMRGDRYYLQLVGDISTTYDTETIPEDDLVHQVQRAEEGNTAIATNSIRSHIGEHITSGESTEHYFSRERRWQLQFRDLPEVAGRRPVSSRLMVDLNIACDDPLLFLSSLNYS